MAIRKLFEKVAKAIKWEHIDDNAVRENCIQDSAVTETKYASNSVPERAYRTDSVSNRALAPSAVGTSQVQNGAITPDKLAGGSKDKATIGLGNVDNTSDVDKPISSATQSALDGKEAKFSSGQLDQYLRGDKTFVRLDTTSVMAQTNIATGNVNNFTAPGIYMYQTATNLPGGAGAVGTLTVTSNTAQQRTQLLTDSNGFAWVRGYDGSVWSAWRALTQAATPMFYGRRSSQVHAAMSEERCNYTSVIARHATNSGGSITLSRAGTYLVQAQSSGPWRSQASGFGRGIRIQHKGSTVTSASTDVPIVWGDGVGAFAVFAMVYLNVAAGDTIEGRLAHNTNKTIESDHSILITWIE